MPATNLETITGRISFDASRNPIKGTVMPAIRYGAPVYKAKVNPCPMD